jgi:hypothetical protein
MAQYQVRDLVALLQKPRSSVSRWLDVLPPFSNRAKSSRKASHFDATEVLCFLLLDALSRDFGMSESTLARISACLAAELRASPTQARNAILHVSLNPPAAKFVPLHATASEGIYLSAAPLLARLERYVGLDAFESRSAVPNVLPFRRTSPRRSTRG